MRFLGLFGQKWPFLAKGQNWSFLIILAKTWRFCLGLNVSGRVWPKLAKWSFFGQVQFWDFWLKIGGFRLGQVRFGEVRLVPGSRPRDQGENKGFLGFGRGCTFAQFVGSAVLLRSAKRQNRALLSSFCATFRKK